MKNCLPLAGAALAATLALVPHGANASNLGTLTAVPIVTSGLSLPLFFIQDPVHDNTQYIVEQRGRIRTLQNGVLIADFLDLTGIASTSGSERGLFSLAFDPDYATNRRVFVCYTRNGDHASVVRRYLRQVGNDFQVDPASGVDILVEPQPFSNHNGGLIRFGPDGYLYVTLGDGGSSGDPGNRAQTVNTRLGKMLRIDVSAGGPGFAIPPSNPFLPGNSPPVAGALPEIWAFGLRNPWRWAFDDMNYGANNALLIADVGQNAWEEVNYQPPNTGALNFGWRRFEGNAQFSTTVLAYEPHTPPIHVYANPSVGRSITGGFVYRGSSMCSFHGRYFFGDYQARRMWSFRLTPQGTAADVREHTSELLNGATLPLLSSFGRDAKGDLYFVGYSPGAIYRITSDDAAVVGDVNGDGIVDFTDFSIVLSGYGTDYDFSDFSAVLADYGMTCGKN